MDASNKEFADGFMSLAGGMHSGIDPAVLNADGGMYSVGVNVTARSGVIKTRPAFVAFASLPSGKFQGLAVWKLDSVDRFVYVVDGRLYSRRVDTLEEVSHGPLFSSTVDRVHFCQAYQWMVIQDGASAPQALEEDSTSGAAILYARPHPYTSSDSPPKELCLTPGTVMAYAHGRIHYVPTELPAISPVLESESDPEQLNSKPEVFSGDSGRACFVSSDVLDIYVPEFTFRMSEHRVLNEGGGIELPLELGFIYGMAPIRNAASGTGTGPLVVFGREGVCAFDVSVARKDWKNINIGQVLFSTVGTVSPYSLVQMNADIGFIDTEGKFRTLKFESSQAANTLTSLPMSHELDVIHQADTTPYLPSASASFVDSRLCFTLKGDTGPVYKGVASLDFAKVYSMGGPESPSFDGVWTGFDFQQVLAARDSSRKWRQFAVEKTGADNALLMLSETATSDLGSSLIESMIVTRFMDFGTVVETKVVKMIELWLSDMSTDSSVTVYGRPRGYPGWVELGTKSFNIPGGTPQARRRVLLPVAQEDLACDPVSSEKLNIATQIQFAIVWRGRLTIDRFRAVAALRVDPATSCLEADNAEDNRYDDTNSGVTLDYFRYRARG